MKVSQIAGLVLVAAGTLGLVYGQLEYTREKSQVSLGPLELSMKQKESLQIPPWLSIGGIALGCVLLVLRGKR